jgi:hypothetical protein
MSYTAISEVAQMQLSQLEWEMLGCKNVPTLTSKAHSIWDYFL